MKSPKSEVGLEDDSTIKFISLSIYNSITLIYYNYYLNMSLNPHFFMLSKTLRSRSQLGALALMSQRGGHFVKPDPKVPKPYQHTRRIHLEDVNTYIYHDLNPEYYMHLHSPNI